MKLDLLMVGLGGFFGSIGRYVIYLIFAERAFPWATLLINVSGCLLIGVLAGALERSTVILTSHRQLFLMASVGFLGAFTTFSAFGLETVNLFRNDQTIFAVINVVANVSFGLAAVMIGRFLTLLY